MSEISSMIEDNSSMCETGGGGAALLVVGTGSDAGKTTMVAGLCRLLARRGVAVAPFKAQNMANHSAVTADGREIGRAQALQALAAGVEPEAAMNPVLLKPTGERTSQVVVMGRPFTDPSGPAAGPLDGHGAGPGGRPDAEADAVGYGDLTAVLRPVVLDALADLRRRFDVVVCEGAGSASEINLRDRDLVNAGLARDADLPIVLVGDIERGGVFASLFGTWALLEEPARLRGFVVNRFRGEASLLDAGYAELTARTGVPVLGTLPWLPDLRLDGEDGQTLADRDGGPPIGLDGIDVAVIRFPRIANPTDVDPLAAEPGVAVRYTTSPAVVRRADLVVLPGTKATAADLAWLRATGLADAVLARAAAGDPVLGVCGGHQILGRTITDDVEGRVGTVAGLGLLPHATTFHPDKLVRRVAGDVPALGGVAAEGYEIRHGRTDHDDDGDPVLLRGPVMGTSWHGILDRPEPRVALLRWVAQRRRLSFTPVGVDHAARRMADLDRLADAVEAHLDVDEVLAIAATAGRVPAAELPAAARR